MKKNTFWATYHGKDLDKLIDKAHSELPDDFYEGDIKLNTQFLNDEWVVTVTATRELNFHYEIICVSYYCAGHDFYRGCSCAAGAALMDHMDTATVRFRCGWHDGKSPSDSSVPS